MILPLIKVRAIWVWTMDIKGWQTFVYSCERAEHEVTTCPTVLVVVVENSCRKLLLRAAGSCWGGGLGHVARTVDRARLLLAVRTASWRTEHDVAVTASCWQSVRCGLRS